MDSNVPHSTDGGRNDSDEGDGWEQRSGFSIFFDVIPGAFDSPRWRTRLYHDESDEIVTIDGTDSEPWMQWIEERRQRCENLANDDADPRSIGETTADSNDVVVEVSVRVEGSFDLRRDRVGKSGRREA